MLAGFIPSSIEKAAAVQAGARPPFPLIMHLHALLMGAFLLLLLAQTALVATGRSAQHMRLGLRLDAARPGDRRGRLPARAGQLSSASGARPRPRRRAARAELMGVVGILDNILLLQLRIGILFPIFIWIGLRARRGEPGLHKRMMILATAVALPAGIDRIPWLPTTMPLSPLAPGSLHPARDQPDAALGRDPQPLSCTRPIGSGSGCSWPAAVVVHGLWDTAWWHAMAPRVMGV